MQVLTVMLDNLYFFIKVVFLSRERFTTSSAVHCLCWPSSICVQAALELPGDEYTFCSNSRTFSLAACALGIHVSVFKISHHWLSRHELVTPLDIIIDPRSVPSASLFSQPGPENSTNDQVSLSQLNRGACAEDRTLRLTSALPGAPPSIAAALPYSSLLLDFEVRPALTTPYFFSFPMPL